MRKKYLKDVRRVVIKVGTSTLTYETGLLNLEIIEKLVRQIANLHNKGYEVILVSSGAVGAGLGVIPTMKFPLKSIPDKQAAAAVGQVALTHMYQKLFSEYSKNIGQILLTQSDIDDRKRYLNARDAFFKLLENKVIPIVNENDAVVTDEIKVGDNDTLSALVTNLIEADLLIILSDIDGLYDSNPQKNSNAQIIRCVENVDENIISLADGAGSQRGTGGMITKLKAAEIVTSYGGNMIIANGKEDNVLNRVLNNETLGTLFLPKENKINAKKQWIGLSVKSTGAIIIDQGAKKAILNSKSLLPVGIVKIKGHFSRGDIVKIVDQNDIIVAQGIVNYDSVALDKLKGITSDQINEILGYKECDEAVHIDNMLKKEE